MISYLRLQKDGSKLQFLGPNLPEAFIKLGLLPLKTDVKFLNSQKNFREYFCYDFRESLG